MMTREIALAKINMALTGRVKAAVLTNMIVRAMRFVMSIMILMVPCSGTRPPNMTRMERGHDTAITALTAHCFGIKSSTTT